MRALTRRHAQQVFVANRWNNLFAGVYDTWDQAEAAANAYGQTGYDNAASAAMYDDRIAIDTHDYPALCWLMRSMQEGQFRVGDVGGHIGIKFLAFRAALAAWPSLHWTVHDVPAVVARGRDLAAGRGDAAALSFADKFDDLQDCDVLLASGVLQYLPGTLDDMMKGWRRRPQRIIINTLPLHDTTAFFTVNSIGTAFCPYRIQTEAALVDGLARLGYRVRERWINPGKAMTLPARPDLSLTHYCGFCLDNDAAGASR